MPNTSLSDAIKEAYALAPREVVVLETLQISNSVLAEDIFLVKDLVGNNFTLEDDSVEFFEPAGFRLELPQITDIGIQELILAIDNTDRRITDFVNAVKGNNTQTEIRYRPYLASDLTTPQLETPLLLYLKDISISAIEVQGKATFADVINKKFPNEWYTRTRFPSLGN